MKVEVGATLEVLLAGPAALDAATLLLEDVEVGTVPTGKCVRLLALLCSVALLALVRVALGF